jgi:hypothetical protein
MGNNEIEAKWRSEKRNKHYELPVPRLYEL